MSLTGASDPGSADTQAGFTYAFDTGGGLGAFGPASSFTYRPVAGTYIVAGAVRDASDGQVTTYTAPLVIAPFVPTSIFATPVAGDDAIATPASAVPEGTAITLNSPAFTLVPGGTTSGLSYAWTVAKSHGATTTPAFAGGAGTSLSFTPDDDGTTTSSPSPPPTRPRPGVPPRRGSPSRTRPRRRRSSMHRPGPLPRGRPSSSPQRPPTPAPSTPWPGSPMPGRSARPTET